MTTVHSLKDIRIFLKECQSLAGKGFEVCYVLPGEKNKTLQGIQIYGVEKGNGNRLYRMTKTVNRIYEKALSLNADIYHFHDPELIPAGLKLKSKDKKVIYDVHEDLPRALLSKSWVFPLMRRPMAQVIEIYENWAARRFDCLMTATPYITQRFLKNNLNTININNYPMSGELQSDNLESPLEKERQVCYVGGLGPIRGINQLLAAADLINGVLHIAGPISPEKTKAQLIAHKNVECLGILDRVQVKGLLASSVAGIVTFLPEPNHVNAQPNKMFEYMSAGIPVICSDFPLWRSIIEKYQCGICVNPEKPEAIAEAINYLLDNPQVSKQMGLNGRRAVETEYNWEHESSKLIEAYRSLIK